MTAISVYIVEDYKLTRNTYKHYHQEGQEGCTRKDNHPQPKNSNTKLNNKEKHIKRDIGKRPRNISELNSCFQ